VTAIGSNEQKGVPSLLAHHVRLDVRLIVWPPREHPSVQRFGPPVTGTEVKPSSSFCEARWGTAFHGR